MSDADESNKHFCVSCGEEFDTWEMCSCIRKKLEDLQQPLPPSTPSSPPPHALTREQCSLCTANRPRLCDQHYKQGADELLKHVTAAIQDQQTPGGVKATYEQLLELCNQQRQALAQQAQEIENLKVTQGYNAKFSQVLTDQAQEVERLKKELKKWRDSFVGHVYVKNEEWSARCEEVRSLQHRHGEVLIENQAQRETIRRLEGEKTLYRDAIIDVGIKLGLIMPERVKFFSTEGVQAVDSLQARLTASEAKRKWTKKPPTVAGWYWWKHGGSVIPRYVHSVTQANPPILRVECPDGWFEDVDKAGGEWQGPLTPGEE